MSSKTLAAVLLCAGWIYGQSAQAQPASDPDWPCIQRLVPELSAGQMWAGPSLDQLEGFWQADPEIAPLALKLIDVSLSPDEISERIDGFASGLADDERATRLPLLFKASLETLNGERSSMIRKIIRYSARQKALAERIAQDNARLKGVRLDAEPDERQLELLSVRERRDWDLRIFDDRYKMLSLICDQPVRLEQRAFALARAIQEKLP